VNVDSLSAEEIELLRNLEGKGSDGTSLTGKRLLISPNPSEGKIQITYKEKMNEVQVFDMTGKALEKVFANSNRMTLDLTNFPVGKYIVRAFSDTGNGAGIAIIAH
jgi:hypothetical protein